ncbi:hypothetical protein OF83DRAFT_6661 [Amylostereum chailletii]|nr:hypothetical protein OF83DRAFT_6661 [Amylostereum chailletii]
MLPWLWFGFCQLLPVPFALTFPTTFILLLLHLRDRKQHTTRGCPKHIHDISMARGNGNKLHDASAVSHADLSSRHFPDTTDASMTFQIPFEAGSATRLLDDDRDFLQGLDDSFGTPRQPARPLQPPLTLEELTPRKKHVRHNLYDALSTNLHDESTPMKRQRFSPIRALRPPLSIIVCIEGADLTNDD